MPHVTNDTHRLLAAGLVVVTLGVGRAQQPTFRSGVEITAMDVTVVDNDGRPLTDLTLNEFRVQIDGRDRRVTSAQWVPLVRPVTTPPPPPQPEGYSTNQDAARGRLIVFAIDQPNIESDRAMTLRPTVNAFIDQLEPADRIAAVGLGGGGSTSFTSDHAAVKAAIALMNGNMRAVSEMSRHSIGLAEAAEIAGGNTSTLERLFERECISLNLSPEQLAICREQLVANSFVISTSVRSEAQESLLSLRGLLKSLATVSGPKTVVIVSGGFVLGDEQPAIVEIGSLAAAAQTSLYVLRVDNQPMDASNARRSPTAVADRQLREDGVDLLASVAKGLVLNVLGTGVPALQRLSREISGYYLVGVESTPTDTDGKAHPISVQVSRRGAIVRARRELSTSAAASAGALSPLEEIAAALNSPLLVPRLPVRVATFSMLDPKDSKIQVVIHADVGTDYSSAKAVTLGYVVTDARGTVVVHQTAEGRLPPAVSGTPSPLVFSGGVTLDPGEYTLKFAVTEGDRLGSVEHRIHAALIDAGAIKLSELMIGGPIDGRQLLGPTVGHEIRFGSVHGYIEAYGSSASMLTMRYEVAPGLNEPSLFGAVVPGRSAGEDRNVFSYAMPVRQLAPGQYYLRASLSAGADVVKRVARAFRVETAPAVAAAGTGAPRPVALTVGDELLARRFRREDVSRRDTLSGFRNTLAPGASRAFDEGIAALVLGDDARAEQSFRGALEVGLAGADSTAVLAYLGATFAASGRDPEAISVWQIALVDGSGYPQLYEWLGDALMRLRNVDEARPILEEAIGKWPAETRFARPLAVVYAKAGRGREALALLERYLGDHREDTEALYLGVEWMYQLHAAGAYVRSREEDLKAGRIWADAYTIANGPQVDNVKRWMLSLESPPASAPAGR